MQYELPQNRAERPRKLSGILLHFLGKEKVHRTKDQRRASRLQTSPSPAGDKQAGGSQSRKGAIAALRVILYQTASRLHY